jgi:hypothetical protein
MARRLLMTAAVSATLALPAVAASGTRLPSLLVEGSGNRFAVRPASIGYTGDGTGFIGRVPGRVAAGRLRWQVWSHTGAYGVGTVWLDNCTPDCASGTFHSYRGNVLADHPRSGHFTRMTIRFPYQGHLATDVRVLQHSGRSYSWAILRQTGL